jgi:hypothetical protein
MTSMSTSIPYTSTEKKRIRKSFAKRTGIAKQAGTLTVPYLLATQLESYAAFLQEDTPHSAAIRGCRQPSARYFRYRAIPGTPNSIS